VALDLECLEVRERTLPALNDAFAAEVTDGAHQTLLELRLEVRRQLKKAAEQSAEMTYFEQVMEQVLKGTKLAYAPVMVDEYVDDMLNELEENLQRGGLTLDNFLKIEDKTRAQLQEEYGAKAEERLQRALVLGEVVEAEELNISDEDVEAEIDTMTKEADDPQREALREKYAGENARRSLRMRMLTRQSIERLIAIAKGEDPPKGPARRPKLYEKVSSEYVATLDDLRDEREAESKNANKVSDLFPGARTEKGIARLD
jgi:trigger factor